MADIPERVRSRTFPTTEELQRLRDECKLAQISKPTMDLFDRLASYTPTIRLVINLKHMLGLLAVREVTNILNEGLMPEERKALIELDLSNVSTAARETAHGLLNIHERWALMKRLADTLRKASELADHRLEPPPTLNDVLGN